MGLRQRHRFCKESKSFIVGHFCLVAWDEPHVSVGALLGQEKCIRKKLTHKKRRKSAHVTREKQVKKESNELM